ncbi:hypothetical protein KK062_22485 [Fulvivirgaceae bacterium PWU5]|uniref:Phosphoesterase n=1 Tax=Dawidia cretensis TaxID=2782350 RepID=A0AAP2GVK8_9BACT|nr:alkaline phosphatase family protein [Dawidia cretensis]MBT1711028.1 hypothetical protein [Dawidia cretensis]
MIPINNANKKVKYVFVLMLENRSFDHMLGFSGITGTDAETGKPTKVNGLSGQSNQYDGKTYPVAGNADWQMPFDPGHEFMDVLEQLCGAGVNYKGGPYPTNKINNAGFVSNYATTTSPGEGGATSNFGEIMKCYSPALLGAPTPFAQLPVLTALAKEFAVCDCWYSSLPGPTWPNRFFVHAASSGGLDHSPTSEEILDWESNPLSGYTFPNKSIFDRLNANNIKWWIYEGAAYPVTGSIPNVTAIEGVHQYDVSYISRFASDLGSWYPQQKNGVYTFIEPNYGDLTNYNYPKYTGGQSQHPEDDVRNGEAFIKQVYEALVNSTIWEESMLIITYDEHGGFYDHVAPTKAPEPNDNSGSTYNQYGFLFDQYGIRVPAIVISAYTPKNVIDHRVYDHSSVPATVAAVYNMETLTDRDGKANNVTWLASLNNARTDVPTTLPSPGVATPAEIEAVAQRHRPIDPESTVDHGNLPGFLHLVLKAEKEMATTEAEKQLIMEKYKQIKTKAQAKVVMEEAIPRIQAWAEVHGRSNH